MLISVSELLSINYPNTQYGNPVVPGVPACDLVSYAPMHQSVIPFSPSTFHFLRSRALLLTPLDFNFPLLFCPVGFVIFTPVFPTSNLVPLVLVFSSVLLLVIKLRHKMVLRRPSIFTSTRHPCVSKLEKKSNPTKLTFPLPLSNMCFA